MERPSRRNANKAAKAQAATAGLKDLKDKGLKRFDTLAEAEDNNVYDVVREALRSLPPSPARVRVWRLNPWHPLFLPKLYNDSSPKKKNLHGNRLYY